MSTTTTRSGGAAKGAAARAPVLVIKQTDRMMLERCPDDFVAFCRWYFNDWEPLPFQRLFYEAPQKDKLLIAGVRTGKSAGVAAAMMHYCWRHPAARVANASVSADQANVIYSECLNFALRPRFEHWISKIERHPYPRIVFQNGSEIWFRSVGYEAELWRGWEFDWINVDEAAYITHELAIDTLRGRLIGVNALTGKPRAGIFTMTSTPKGRGWLYERWKKGDPTVPGSEPERYLSMRARTRDNIHLDPEAINELERHYSERLRRQELEGQFVEDLTLLFPFEQLLYACSTIHPEVVALNEAIRHWLMKDQAASMAFSQGELNRYELAPQPGHWYLCSWDLGKKTESSGRGATVGGVLDITERPWKLVAYRWESGAGYLQAMEWIKEWHARYSCHGQARAETIIDATGKGDVVNEILEQEARLPVDGIVYSRTSKPMLIHAAQVAFERGLLRLPFIKRLVDQFAAYELDDKDLAQDIVMMLAQALYRARERMGDETPRVVQKAIVSSYRLPESDLRRFHERRLRIRAGAAGLPGLAGMTGMTGMTGAPGAALLGRTGRMGRTSASTIRRIRRGSGSSGGSNGAITRRSRFDPRMNQPLTRY